jgi:Tfp pilus assembly protein PilO
MAKKCLEEFNPWPAFVDIFSSTILVLLLFMLILIVNLGYYAQFKFKVSYTGTIATNQIILKEKMRKEKAENTKKIEVVKKQNQILQQGIVQEEKKDLERVGVDQTQVDKEISTLQKTVQNNDYLIINFTDNEILLDKPIIKQIKAYIIKMKIKFPNNTVIISSVEPKNQISSTVGKQISLARILNTRNLIRKLNYKKSDVRIRRMDAEVLKTLPVNEAGIVFVTIQVHN